VGDTLTLRQLNRATLARQLLLERSQLAVADAVERLCGLQAQEPKHPFVGLWTRLEGFERDDLRAALEARAVVRATAMRGTLHLVGARDLVSIRRSLQPMLDAGLGLLGDRAAGLDTAAVVPVARRLLAPGPRTFGELRALLVAEFPTVDERALGFAVRMSLPLVMVPTADTWAFPSVAAFTLADAWLGTPLDASADPVPLIRRYLAAFGPASVADAQAFTGLKGLADAFARLRPELRVFRDERGRELYDVPDGPLPDEDVAAPVRFLPEFDSLLLAHADRTRIVADEHRAGLVTRNLRVRATFLVDGFVRGTWTATRARTAATLELQPFAPLATRVSAALGEEGETLLRFLEPGATSFAVTQGA
jgi:hypothetical protein